MNKNAPDRGGENREIVDLNNIEEPKRRTHRKVSVPDNKKVKNSQPSSPDRQRAAGKENGNNRPPRIVLPFTNRKKEPGEWAYEHRAGLLSMVIVVLLIGIVIMTAKISVRSHERYDTIYVNIPENHQPLEFTPEQIEKMLARQHSDFSDISNVASNAAAEYGDGGRAGGDLGQLDNRLRDADGTDADEIYNEAAALQEKMAENSAAYEAGLAAERRLKASAGKGGTAGTTDSNTSQYNNSGKTGGGGGSTTRVKGRVTVEYMFTNPTRDAVNLIVPAYLCEGGGEVIVAVTLGRNGKVISANTQSSSTKDNCIINAALRAARSSSFNINNSAPEKHIGTITYIFIPQK